MTNPPTLQVLKQVAVKHGTGLRLHTFPSEWRDVVDWAQEFTYTTNESLLRPLNAHLHPAIPKTPLCLFAFVLYAMYVLWSSRHRLVEPVRVRTRSYARTVGTLHT